MLCLNAALANHTGRNYGVRVGHKQNLCVVNAVFEIYLYKKVYVFYLYKKVYD